MRIRLQPGGVAAFGVLLLFFTPTVLTAGPQILHGQVPTVVKSLSPIGLYPVTNRLNLAIALPLRNPAALTNLLQEIYDPASPKFHQYLTPEEFTAQFGPTPAAYEAVIAFATAHGLRVTATHPNRMLLDVSGSVADIERAFHLTLHTYRHPTEPRTFYAPDTEPSVNLAVPILQVVGLDNYERPHPAFKIRAHSGPGQVMASGSGPGGNYMGYDFRAAYAPGVALNGAGQTVALFEMDGYYPGDITYYENTNGLPSVTLTNVLLGGATGIPSDPNAVVEVSLDIEMAIAIAPQLARVMVYEAPVTSVGAYDILNQIATDDQAAQISSSWVIDRIVTNPVPDAIYLEYAAQGQSFFQASGDQDAYVPGTFQTADNSFITTVGGTTLTTTGPGGAYMSETVWQWGGGTGSGGGISTNFAIPAYQQGINMATNHGSTTMRNIPDVALTADQVYVRANGRDYVGVGGTSCAAPLWAGFMALVNQEAAAYSRPAAGFINPAVYALAQTPNYPNYFHDIVVGNNTNISSHNLFFAVPGYDLCTGWGTPAGQALIDALAIPDALFITPAAGFSSSGGQGGPFTVTAQSLTLTNTGTNALTWSLVNTSLWLNASATGGTLAPGGLATDVTVSLNSVASNLVAGTYKATLWFTNLTSGLGQGRTYTLTVLGAPIITNQPISRSVTAGSTATFTVGAIGLPPLYYQWFFGGTNLPSGTNAALTLPNVTTNQAGSYYAFVSNSLGSATSAVAVLTVVPGPVFLTGNYLYLPIQTNGVFLADSAGGKFNPAGTGGASGVDFWVPGTPVYNTVVGVGGIAYVNGSAPVVSGFSSISVNNLSSGDTQEALISGVVRPGLNFSRDISFGVNSKVIRIVDTLQNTGPVPLFSVVTLDTADPDQDIYSPTNSTYSTLNDVVSVYQTNDLVVATGPDTGLSVGFGSDSGLQIPSAVGFNNLNPYTLTNVVDPGGVLADIDINLVQNYGTLDAGQSRSVVWYIAFGASKAEVLTNFALASPPDALQITPLTGFSSSGGRGGPFTITTQSLTLTNLGTNALTWLLVNSSLWLDASPTGGALDSGGPATNVTVSLNSVASNLVAGTYTATLWFTNLTSGVGQGRTYALTVLGAPIITNQPVSRSVTAGSTATFTVGAIGLPPLYYQWFFGGTNLPSGTNATLTLPDVSTNQAGNYYAVVSNSLGSATSTVATLTVTVASVPVFLTGNYLYLPIQTNGVFLADNTGGKFNPAGTGGASGVDFWEPGTPVYNTAVGVGGTVYLNGSAPLVSGFGNMSVYNLSSGDVQEALISGVVRPGLNFTRDISFGVNSQVVRIVDTLQNTGAVPLTNVVTLDTADPDQDYWSFTNSTTYTLNDVVSVYQTNDLVVATGPDTGLSVGFGSDSGLQIPSAVGFNNVNPYTLTNVVDPGGVLADIDINLVQNYGTLDAGQSRSVVWFVAFGASKAEVLTNFALASPPDALQIAPLTGFSSSGGVGGPFTVTSQSLTLTNVGTNTLAWSLVNTSPWLDASPAGGSLVPGGPATNVIVNLNSVASNLVAGTYTATLWFTNLTSGLGQDRTYTLTVLGAPVITNQPVSQTVQVGSTTTFTVGAIGLPPLYYQWFFDDTNLPSATNAALTLSNVSTNQVGDYYAVVSNSLGSATSAVAVLTLTTKLQASAVVYLRSTIGEPWGKADDDGILTMVFGSGWQDLRYETVNPAALFSPTNRLIFMEGGDNNALAMGTFLMNNLPAISNWVYAGGGLFVNAAPNQGANQYLGFGATLIYPDFTSIAGASVPLHPIFAGPFTPVGLTWTGSYFGHATVTGAGLTSLITNASSGNFVLAEKNYGAGHLLFGGMTLPSFHSPQPQGTNLLANILSYAGNQFKIGTNVPPVITSQPVGVTVPVGSNATFSVTAIGSPPLNYLWWRNGAPIPAATNWSYTLTNAQISDSGSQFSCVITNPVDSVTSSVALLKVVTMVANDQCSRAIVITGPNYTNAQSTASATSAGDPVPGCVPSFGNGVWYQFTAALNGQLEVDTFGSDFDTGLALYTGGCGALTEVACNDDTSGLQSQIIVPVSAGTSYYILVGGYNGYTGHLAIHLAFTVPVTLDHFGWSAIKSPKGVNAPFAAMITALSPLDVTVTNFNGSVSLSGSTGGSQATNRMFDGVTATSSASGTYTWGFPFTPTNNLTVTHVRSYFGSKVSVWTSGGVLLATQSVSGPAGTWTETALAAPLALSAGSNYVVAAYCSSANYYWVNNLAGAFADGTVGTSLFSATDSFPTTTDSGVWPLVGLRYAVGASQPVPISPTTAGPFTNGVWGGNIAVLQAATNVVLLASDGNGHTGSSNPFHVVSLEIRQVVVLPDGSIQLTLGGSLGDTFRVLGSTNLVDWQTIATLTNLTGTVQFTDPLATNYSQRFYRCISP